MALYHTVCMMCCFRFDNSLRTRLTILRSKMAPWSIEILRTEWQHYAPPRMSIRIRSFGDPQPSNKLFCSEKLMLQFIFIKKSNIRRHMYSLGTACLRFSNIYCSINAYSTVQPVGRFGIKW